jgi:hypothetical protein
MSLLWRNRLVASGAALAAIWLGVLVADGDWVVPSLLAVLAVGAVVAFWAEASLATLTVGALLFGYLVGNRGFAQLMPFPGLPLLPAEIGLVVAGGWIAVQCAFAHRLPYRRDALNGLIFAWLVAGSVRAFFDVRIHGVVALRDFAMVYYAAFFFVAQHLAAEAAARRFLVSALVAASALQPLAALASEAFPAFFHSFLSWRGVPLILFKGDLALTFMAVSAFVLAFAVAGRARPFALVGATVLLALAIGGDNRASILGALAGLGWLALSSARRFVAAQAAALAGLFLIVSAAALLTEADWAEKKFHGVTERVQSLTDYFGHGTYVSAESAMKGDNNRFRSLWWEKVVEETLADGPVFGLGFGHDLARNFLREYNPDMAEDFTARSPHSILVSIVGRLGFAGLALFLVLMAAVAVRTWRAVRRPDTPSVSLGLWAAAWTIFVSACFGVVLEGPMGAVVFWTLLGLLNVPAETAAPSAAAVDSPPTAARPAVAAHLVADREPELATAATPPARRAVPPPVAPAAAPALPAPAAAAGVRAPSEPHLRLPPAAPPSPSA